MAQEHVQNLKSADDNAPRHLVRLPGFVVDEQVGLGTLVKRVTSRFGVRACIACEKRAAAMNDWLGFVGTRQK